MHDKRGKERIRGDRNIRGDRKVIEEMSACLVKGDRKRRDVDME